MHHLTKESEEHLLTQMKMIKVPVMCIAVLTHVYVPQYQCHMCYTFNVCYTINMQ